MNSSADQYSSFNREFQQALRTAQQNMQPLVAARRQLNAELQRSLAPMIVAQARAREMAAAIQPQVPDLSAVQRQLDYIKGVLAPHLQEIEQAVASLPPRMREALLVLARHGWYFDDGMDFTTLWELRDALLNGDIGVAESQLCQYFEARVDSIESHAVGAFPERSHLIRSALTAHRDGSYDLSIPVLLAQIDGICKDTTDGYYFMKSGARPQTAAYVEAQTAGTWTKVMLSPLAEALPISMSANQRGDDFSGLNRHQVLHGESLDYGTKANGLKALSLLSYVSCVLGEVRSGA